jgi:cytosine/adenosine deaminase-related metal-dependent hydrolase
MPDTLTLTARWVFPVASPPLERGLVTIAGDRIATVEPHGVRTPDLDLGDVALIPGLVNAHTHLDLTGACGQTPPTIDFTAWLQKVIAFRRQRSLDQTQVDVQSGIAECIRQGTTLVGEIAAEGGTWDALKDSPLRAVVFRELLGLPHDRALRALSSGRTWLGEHAETPTCKPGWSPHAPYSVSYLVLENAGRGYGSSPRPFRCAIHLAESAEEQKLLEAHNGPFVSFLSDLGVWAPDQLARDWDDVLELTSRSDQVIYAHCNYLPANASIPPHGTVVYCPRTHAAFGHPPHPFREFLTRGVRVALGTDSLASNPDLSVLAEARFVHSRHPDLPGDTLLRMATLSGAEALGWADETGSLEPGKSADLAVVELPPGDDADPYRLLFDSDRTVRATWFRGRRVYPSD